MDHAELAVVWLPQRGAEWLMPEHGASTMMNEASCLCGGVRWSQRGPLGAMSHCHCGRCRKAHGSAFATYVAGRRDGFGLHAEVPIGRYETSPRGFRHFCTRCASVVPGEPKGEWVFLPAGNFHADPGVRPRSHLFVASKAPWYTIDDSLPCSDTWPPGTGGAVLEDFGVREPPGPHPRGSCLCGAVGYQLAGAPRRAVNCHCSRCRRARSAAFASILFAPVAYTRGQEKLASYTLAGVPRFSYAFCTVCGSALPRADQGDGLVGVPMGTLDDDPGMRPQAHIFVASKAPWYTIPDALPQFEEFPPAGR